MLILPEETVRNVADNFAGDLPVAVQDPDWNLADVQPLWLSVFSGTAEPLENGEGIDVLIKRADDAMHASK